MKTIAYLMLVSLCAFATDKEGAAKRLNTYAPGTSAVSRTVQDKLNEHPSVKDYGAKCDGVTDDTTAIQAAIDAVAESGGGTLLVPAGTCEISTLTIANPNVHIKGVGQETSFLHTSVQSGTAVLWDASALSGTQSGGGMEDITIYGNTIGGAVPTGTEIGLEIRGTATANWFDLKFRNVAIKWTANGLKTDYNCQSNFDNVTLYVMKPTTGVALDVYNGHERFFTNLFAYNPAGEEIAASIRINNGSIGDYWISPSIMGAVDGVSITPSSGTASWGSFVDLKADSMTGSGVKIAPASGATATVWRFIGTWASNLPIGFSIGGAGTTSSINILGGSVRASASGIVSTSASKVAVVGLNIEAGTDYGVQATDSPGMTVASNVFDGFAYGIKADGTTTVSGTHSNSFRNFTSGYTSFGTGATDVSFYRVVDEQIFDVLQQKNDGGSSTVAGVRDYRGYAGNNTGTALAISSWYNPSYSAGNLLTLQTIDGGSNPVRLLIDNATGGGFVGADWTWNNNTKIMWKDASAKSIPGLWLDTSEDFHVGAQLAPTTGNGALSLYARGQKLLTLMAPPATGRNTFYPLVSGQTQLGAATGCGAGETDPCHWGPTYIGPLSIYTDTPADPAYIDLYAGTYGESKAVRMYGPATFGAGTGYSIYWPATAPATGSVLGSSSGGTLAWLPNGGLPAVDTTAIVKGSDDPTKQVRIEVDGLTTETTRTITVPDSDITLMSTNTTQTVTGTKTIDAYLQFSNDKKISMADTGGTQREIAWFDTNNDFHIGPQAAPASGNGATSIYARGTKVVNVFKNYGGSPRFEPEEAWTTFIGSSDKPWATYTGNRVVLATNAGTAAGSLAIMSGDGASKGTNIYAASAVTSTYNIYLPPAQATAAGQTLINDGSGVLSWGSSALPAGTANYTLRYNGTSSAWEASSALQNNGTTVSLYDVGIIQYRFGTAGNWASFHANGTYDSPTATAANDQMGVLSARGYYVTGGPAYTSLGNALIRFYAAENFTSTAHGTYMTFGTTSTGSTTSSERMRITDAGSLLVGTTDSDGTPAAGRLVIKGSTADGSTYNLVARDSGESNVWTLDTDGNTLAAAGAYYGWSGRSRIWSSADGKVSFTEADGAGFTGLFLGGESAGNTYLKRDSGGYGEARLTLREGDDSGYAQLDTGDLYVAGTKRIYTTGRFDIVTLYQSGNARIDSSGQGIFQALYAGGNLIANSSGVLFSATGYTGTITVRKGDDSGSCTISVSAGIVTATTCS